MAVPQIRAAREQTAVLRISMANEQTAARTDQHGARTDRHNGVMITESAYQHGFLGIHRLYRLRFQTVNGSIGYRSYRLPITARKFYTLRDTRRGDSPLVDGCLNEPVSCKLDL